MPEERPEEPWENEAKDINENDYQAWKKAADELFAHVASEGGTLEALIKAKKDATITLFDNPDMAELFKKNEIILSPDGLKKLGELTQNIPVEETMRDPRRTNHNGEPGVHIDNTVTNRYNFINEKIGSGWRDLRTYITEMGKDVSSKFESELRKKMKSGEWEKYKKQKKLMEDKYTECEQANFKDVKKNEAFHDACTDFDETISEDIVNEDKKIKEKKSR